RTITNAQAALSLVYSRLGRWRALLSKSSRGLLSPQEIQGLFGELKFLEECIDAGRVSVQAAVEGWQGPLGSPHDFIFDQAAIEIKSISDSSADSVRISSELQLTTHFSTLHLKLIFLTRDADCNRGTSLNTLIRELKDKIQSHHLVQVFDERLSEIGYIDIPDYDFPCFSVVRTRTYQVRDGFPRITPESLAHGISDVSYCIAFSSIAEYICDSFIPGNQE
ncbi:MAG: PD-(D/E)XK motif protein, partial [Nitrosomonas sp.]|nr:PD-(D/E)XK motif protein [Nitrosomonas sp.]